MSVNSSDVQAVSVKPTSKDFLALQAQLESEFKWLMEQFTVDPVDGICITDIESALYDFKGSIYKLSEMCSA